MLGLSPSDDVKLQPCRLNACADKFDSRENMSLRSLLTDVSLALSLFRANSRSHFLLARALSLSDITKILAICNDCVSFKTSATSMLFFVTTIMKRSF